MLSIGKSKQGSGSLMSQRARKFLVIESSVFQAADQSVEMSGRGLTPVRKCDGVCQKEHWAAIVNILTFSCFAEWLRPFPIPRVVLSLYSCRGTLENVVRQYWGEILEIMNPLEPVSWYPGTQQGCIFPQGNRCHCFIKPLRRCVWVKNRYQWQVHENITAIYEEWHYLTHLCIFLS